MKKRKYTPNKENSERNGKGAFSLSRSLPNSKNGGREYVYEGENV